MAFVRLERPVHYGNSGLAFNESAPKDDKYIFTPENTRDVWSACRTITERYGYDFRADENGDFVLATRNNAHIIFDLASSDIPGTQGIHPNAYAGTYLICTGSSGTISLAAARIDLVCSRAPGLGTLAFTVRRVSDNTIVASGSINPDDPGAPAEGLHFYDYRNTVDGANTTVATLYSGWFDDYTVELVVTGTVWLDSFRLWHTDPLQPILPSPLKTEENAISVVPSPTANETRNYVIVVGRRRVLLTDSEKLKANPENPASEFIVRSAVDSASIVLPDSANFYGWPKESIIYDSGIVDEDFAEWLARTFIYRYRDPRPSAPIMHTFLPCIQLRDPIYAEENTFSTMDSQSVLWVKGITHRFEVDEEGVLKATTELETTSYPEYASYEIRQDIDIDKTFFGQPAINIDLRYESLDGVLKVNLPAGEARVQTNTLAPVGDLVKMEGVNVSSGVVSLASQPWPVQPGTVLIKPNVSAIGTPKTITIPEKSVPTAELFGSAILTGAITEPTTVTMYAYNSSGGLVNPGGPAVSDAWTITRERLTSRQFWYDWNQTTKVISIYRNGVGGAGTVGTHYSAEVTYNDAGSDMGTGTGWMGNTPYHQFTKIDYTSRQILVPWAQGDGTTPYQRDFTTCDIIYRALRGDQTTFSDPYADGCPFYDPYTSELGNLIDLKFDALLSGLYRISVRNVHTHDTVAWLSEPTGDPLDPEAHWQYFTAGSDKRISWDGIDQVGIWNNQQAETYAQSAFGAFEKDQKPLPGGGWYAWNREVAMQGGTAPLGLISAQLVGNKPVFGVGTYAEWYIRFEVKNDALEDAYDEATEEHKLQELVTTEDHLGKTYPRVMDTSNPQSPFKLKATNGTPYEARLYTHLPEPTKVALEIRDWLAGLAFSQADQTAVRAGANWGASDPLAYISNDKPVRVRFITQARPGVQWVGKTDDLSWKLFRQAHMRVNLMDQVVIFEGTNYPGQAVESRRVVNRMLTSDDHTLVFVDESFRYADQLRRTDNDEGFEWIFRPAEFKKDWRGIPNEPVKFGDYLQIEEVPRWDSERAIAGSRSRLQIAFMNYLFYLSAYTQDRSGRFNWCINLSFADRSKIVHNSDTISWPDDSNLQFRRSMICRQWTNEKIVGDDGVPRDYPAHMAHVWGATGAIGRYSQFPWHTLNPDQLGGGVEYADDYLNYHFINDHIPDVYGNATNQQLGKAGASSLGAWTWETDPLFPPNPVRDFHGYYLVPPMPDKQPFEVTGNNYNTHFILIQVDPRPYIDSGDNRNSGDDVAAQPTQPLWNSPLRDDTEPYGDTKRFWPGYTVIPGQDHPPTNKTITANTFDYQRQDNLVHYEELRGIYSRTQRPPEAPKKIVPMGPYYHNPFRYNGVSVGRAREQRGSYPLFKVEVVSWFDFTFRREYVWESSRFFPVDLTGQERLDAVNKERIQAESLLGVQFGDVRYDGGAWTGWKDDDVAGGPLKIGPDSTAPADTSPNSIPGLRDFKGSPNVFKSDFFPFAVSAILQDQFGAPNTTATLFHLVLVNERRTNPVI